MVSMWDEAQLRRLKYFEQKLARLASEVGGMAGYQAERITSIADEIDELRKSLSELHVDVEALKHWKQRAGDFLNELRAERKNGENHE